MGSPTLYQFGVTRLHMFRPPVLEVGSKDYGNTASFRQHFPDQVYVGIDMLEGPGVDHVLDLTEDFESVDRVLDGRRFRTVICLCVLEHCARPFKMAENIERLLEPGGVVYVSAPFSWRLHGYPDDYWRFTPSGIRQLFPSIEFKDEDCCLSTSRAYEYFPIDSVPRSEFDVEKGMRKGQYGPLTARWIHFLWRHELLPWLVRWAYLHPPINVNMIGTRHT
jgi:SAM-dependent methyltransferase